MLPTLLGWAFVGIIQQHHAEAFVKVEFTQEIVDGPL